VVIGAGIGGLAAAAGLRAAGWDVTVCERAAALEPVGAGLALAPNGLRALDALGIGDAVRAYAVPQELGIRSPDGRWLLVRRFGGWHEPIPSLLAGVTPSAVLRHDVAELARPLPSFHRGRVVLLGDAAQIR
jgi:2-polyprenyl-6-methoxyphenol hydroxylase-like FAD-dependent oxidoreductase